MHCRAVRRRLLQNLLRQIHSDEIGVLSIYQPSAQSIVEGVKTVENRCEGVWVIPKKRWTTGRPTWILIASNARNRKRFAEHERTLRLDAERAGRSDDFQRVLSRGGAYRKIVGAALIVGRIPPTTSPGLWHHAGEVGWRVGAAVCFHEPVPKHETQTGQYSGKQGGPIGLPAIRNHSAHYGGSLFHAAIQREATDGHGSNGANFLFSFFIFD